jgi:hypothetical protein
MPRISKKLIEEREAFVISGINTDGWDFEKANEELDKKYGMKMNPYRLKELFDSISKTMAEVVPGAPVVVIDSLSQIAQDAIDKCDDEDNYDTPELQPNNSIFNRIQPVITPEGCLPIGELIKTINEGKYEFSKPKKGV